MKNKKSKKSPKFFQAPIKAYQYISQMLPANCRYYPTCSEYAKWQFEFNAPYKALASSTLRILRCNQLFPGGIDYPVIRLRLSKYSFVHKAKRINGKIKVDFWIVPKPRHPELDSGSKYYYIIKDIYDSYLTFPS